MKVLWIREGTMPGSIPQWILDVESDEKIYKKKFNYSLIYILVLGIAYLVVANKFQNNPPSPYIIAILIAFIISVIFIFAKLASLKRNPPNLLAANLYRIGKELENFDLSSPSYIKRNQKYLKNCKNILNNDLNVVNHYFIEDYIIFLKDIGKIILRLNYFYSKKSEPTDHTIKFDLIELARVIHGNYNNLQPEHTAFVEGIVSKLQAIEPQPLNISSISKWVKSFNTGWHNLPYSYRTVFTLLLVGIITFTASSFVMNNFLGMEKSLSNSTASAGTFVLVAAMITQIDKIVPRLNN